VSDLLHKIGAVVGVVVGVAFFALLTLRDLSGCVVVTNPCPALFEQAVDAEERGDVEARDEAIDKMIDAECEPTARGSR
jgi:hypothetical protein